MPHRDYIRHKASIRHRQLTSKLPDGKTVKHYGLTKRPYPGHCELCGRQIPNNLAYHHWDSQRPSVGLWLCMTCHYFAERVEQGLLEPYLKLKAQAEEEWGALL